MFKHNFSSLFQITNKLYSTETKLMSRQPEDLQQRIREIQTKTERTREMAADARDVADSALESTTEVEQVSCPKMWVSAANNQPGCSFSNLLYGLLQEMKNLTKLFEDLKQKNASQTIQDEAGKRLKSVVDEVERMKRGMEDKLRQIQGTPLLHKHVHRLMCTGSAE